MNEATRNLLLAASSALFACSGCAPTVQLATPEPLKVDIAMSIDVRQHSAAGGEKRPLSDTEVAALRRREARSGQIWTMKNDGAAVETEKGYLDARPKTGWNSADVEKLVAEENADRKIMYEAEAVAEGRSVSLIEEEAGRLLRQQAYGRSAPAAEKTK